MWFTDWKFKGCICVACSENVLYMDLYVSQFGPTGIDYGVGFRVNVLVHVFCSLSTPRSSQRGSYQRIPGVREGVIEIIKKPDRFLSLRDLGCSDLQI